MHTQSRENLAEELNDCIFSFDHRQNPANGGLVERQTQLERLIRQLTVAMSKLNELAGDSVPKWSLADALKEEKKKDP